MDVPAEGLPEPAAIDAALARVLARPEFARLEPTSLDRAREWLAAQLRMLRDWLGDGPAFALDVSWLDEALAATAVLLVAVLVHRRGWLRRRRIPRTDAAHAPPAPASGARDDLAAAAAAAGAGRFADAMHALYRGVVRWLDDVGRVPWDPARTGEDVARVLHDERLATSFRRLLRAFYPVAYGARPDAAGAYRRMRAAASEMGVPE